LLQLKERREKGLLSQKEKMEKVSGPFSAAALALRLAGVEKAAAVAHSAADMTRALLLILAAAALAEEDDLIAETRQGRVRGAYAAHAASRTKVLAFKGIPYAAPPLGALRFMPPATLAAPWTSIRDARRFRPVCPQALKVNNLAQLNDPNYCSHFSINRNYGG